MPPIAPTQTPPVWQIAPAQHAPPGAPHIMHMRGMPPPGFAQPRPALHTLPGQHTSPFAPHAMQVCVAVGPWHDRPVPQRWRAEAAAQQAAPLAPHARHIAGAPIAPATQIAPDAVQVPMPCRRRRRHSTPHRRRRRERCRRRRRCAGTIRPCRCPGATAHAQRSRAMHALATQHPPPLQVLAAQQAWPEPPQIGAAAPPAPVVEPPAPVVEPPAPVVEPPAPVVPPAPSQPPAPVVEPPAPVVEPPAARDASNRPRPRTNHLGPSRATAPPSPLIELLLPQATRPTESAKTVSGMKTAARIRVQDERANLPGRFIAMSPSSASGLSDRVEPGLRGR